MAKTNKIFTIFLLLFIGANLNSGITAQTAEPKKDGDKKGVELKGGDVIKSVGASPASLGSIERVPYLSLEPCAKETAEQIKELETAKDVDNQLSILAKRIGNEDEWLRACSVYRLGEFAEEAQLALPVIIKLLKDEENSGVWHHVENALWKIPPQSDISLQDRIKMTQNSDIYTQLYGIYSLMYFKPVLPTDNPTKEKLKTFIETAKSDDVIVVWLSVMGIRRLGFFGVDTSDAIPVLTDLITGNKLNPIYPVRAMVSMRENGLAAAPLLFDILYNPQKFVNEKKDGGNADSYSLYLTSAIALGRMGEILIPLLEKEVEKEPYAVFQVLSNMEGDAKLPILYKALEHKDPKIREDAIKNLPGFTTKGAITVLPKLLKAVGDENEEVQKAAMSKIGSIGRSTEDKSAEFKDLVKSDVIPLLIKQLSSKELRCHAALVIGDFGEDAEIAIPNLVESKEGKNSYCAKKGLYKIGEKGRKHLTKEEIENEAKYEHKPFDYNYNKAKPIKPKKKEEDKKDKDKVLLEKET